MTKRELQVCIGLSGQPVGTLRFEAAGGREHSVFEYAAEWLQNPRAFPLCPAMPLDSGAMFFRAREGIGSPLPPPLADTTPDSWGRTIIRRDRRVTDRAAPPLTELDYLLAVDDFSRMGALRLRDPGADRFLASEPGGRHPIPPLLHLSQLAADVASIERDDPDATALRRLLQVGTSLGGARPKCSVIDHDGALALAKFTSQRDEYPVELAEVMTLRLARRCGLRAPETRIEKSAGLPVAIIRRFDRGPTAARFPYISAQTFLDLPQATGATYAEFADRLRQHGAQPQEQIHELFRRVAFSVLVSNVDDHLQNHGLLHVRNGAWALSPVFDLNPSPERLRELKTAIADPADPAASIELLLDHARRFDLGVDQAAHLVQGMAQTIEAEWRPLAKSVGMTGREIELYRPAFEHGEMVATLGIGNPGRGFESKNMQPQNAIDDPSL